MRALRQERSVRTYWIVVGFASCLLSPTLAVIISVQVNQRTLERQERDRAALQQEGLVRACRLIGAQIDVYSEATTPVGRDAYRTWLTEYRTSGCVPPR